MKILFLLPYPLHSAPSQRFRVEAWLPYLQSNNITYDLKPFLTDQTWSVLYKEGALNKKMKGVVKGFINRLGLIFISRKYDFVFIHREAAPIGPPVFEWLLAKVFKRKVIYDFDDAIWMKLNPTANKITNSIKYVSKIKSICRWSYKIVAGNEFLANFAKKYNDNVMVIPTCVDMVNRYNKIKDQSSERVSVGWTGSHSTLPYLDMIVSVILELEKKGYDFDFIVIADKNPKLPFKNFKFIEWNINQEIEDLMKIDIGVMPLASDEWCEGKCGFKLIQYMSLGIPAVASNVGVNKHILEVPQTGFLCESKEDWINSLELLITSRNIRTKVGMKGRQQIAENYSLEIYKSAFISMFS